MTEPDRAVRPPDECSALPEIRIEIDRIDRLIIALLGDRLGYVRAAAKFKTSEATVRAPDRVVSMLEDRERWATAAGLQPEAVRRLYEHLIDYFTTDELREWTGS